MKGPALIAVATLLTAGSATAQITIQVDPAADQRAISPLIYGVNFASSEQIAAGGLTVTRWGGNRTTRYNYLIDVDNTAFDYFFENLPGCWNAADNWCSNPPSDPKEQSGANSFLANAASANVVALFTVPTMGWVAKSPPKYSHPFDCSCTSAGQDSYDPYESACGNGQIGGTFIDCGPETDTSVAIDPNWVKDWVTYLVGKFGPSNGRRIYALDNEPALWSSTHHDMRKTRLGYDELWQRMRDYAVAILEADPTAEISGPAEWGWPNYFCSDADNINQGCSTGSPDRAAHGGTELVAWLLDRAREYEQQNGVRILHYLDLHYYPQGGSNPTRTRSLWDPTYVDPSWIGDTIRLVPRMRDWVAGHYPGTKLALTEYDFYDHAAAIGAVTYAEVLGILGREGMDMATAWAPPATNEAAFAAYTLFRNYDSAGGAFESTSVRATVSGSGVMAFAAASATRLTVVIANEGSATTATIETGAFDAASTAQVYRHTGTGGTVTADTDIAVSGTSTALALPATSITMVVFSGSNPTAPEAGSGGAGGSGAGIDAAAGGMGGTGGGTTIDASVGGMGGIGGGTNLDAPVGGFGGIGGGTNVDASTGDTGTGGIGMGSTDVDASSGGTGTGGFGTGNTGAEPGTGGIGVASGGGSVGSGGSTATGGTTSDIDSGNANGASSKQNDDGGCGCRVMGAPARSHSTALLALFGAFLFRRRRAR